MCLLPLTHSRWNDTTPGVLLYFVSGECWKTAKKGFSGLRNRGYRGVMTTLAAALDDFILAARADGLRPKTVKWYSSILVAMLNGLGDVEITTVTTRQLREYIVSLREGEVRYKNASQRPAVQGGLSDSSVAGHVRAIARFWKWATDEYQLDSPMRRIRVPQGSTTRPKAIAVEDFVKLFQAVLDNVSGIRDRAILAVLVDTGLRLSGLLGLRMVDLDIDRRVLTVTEKGGKTRTIPFSRLTAVLLRHWLAVRSAKCDRVFVTRDGDAISESGLHEILKRLKKRAGVTGRVNPHSFRHRFAQQYLTGGGDLATLAKLLGHENIQTTVSAYADFSQRDMVALHDIHSPLSSLLQ